MTATAPAPSPGSRSGVGWLWAAALAWLGLFAHGYVENTDAELTMHAAHAWARRGKPALWRDAADATPAERYIAAQVHAGAWFGRVGYDGAAYVCFSIGHQALLVPVVWLGEALASVAPAPERSLRERDGELRGALFWTQWLASFVPVLFAAGSVVVVFALARTLGCGGTDALRVVFAACFCTALWPGSSETMADVPGAFFLLTQAWLVFAYRAMPSRKRICGVGLSGAAAVLLRYPHALPAIVLASAVALLAWRARRRGDFGWLCAGAAPGVLALGAANLWRFGDALETGYGTGANAAWWSYPAYLGVPLILLAPGKGILWFSPPLWSALASALRWRQGTDRFACLVSLACLALPIALHGHTAGWAAGQCWSVRYVTPGVVLTVAVALALAQPWRRAPRRFLVLCAVGFLVAVGGVLTPYRGDRQLAHAAARVAWPSDPEDALSLRYDFAPRFSPLHSHFVYAWLSITGRLDVGGAANTIEPLFGVRRPELADLRPAHVADTRLRHWWWNYGAALCGWPRWPGAVLALFAAVASRAAWRRLRTLPGVTSRDVRAR